LTVDGGQRSLLRLSGRHAGLVGDRLGFKLSGEYFTASDWEFQDPGEPDFFPADAPPGRAGQPNDRVFDLERWVGEGRVDFRPNENSEYVTTLGISRIGSGLEYTGANGTALAKNWNYMSLQQRARIGRFFAQVFANFSDAGNEDSLSLDGTYLLRSGQPIVDQSRMWAAQVQHGLSLGSRQDFVYGVDYVSTNPRTGRTINGRNEDIDDVREVGGYIQSTTRFSDKFDFIAAARVDHNDQVEGTQFSPRAAVIYKPSETQNFRVTFNRAFQTPANFTWFLDLVQQRNIRGSPYDIRALGNPPKEGWSFRRDCDGMVSGGLCMRSIFTGQPDAWVPASAAVAYQGVIAGNSSALVAGLTPSIAGGLGVPTTTAQAVAQQIVAFLGSLQPTATQVGTEIRMIAPGSPNLVPTDVRDIDPIKASFNNTWEVGYKGIIGNRLRVAVDAWTEKRGDVGNPAGLATPNVFFDAGALQTYLTNSLIPAITGALMQPPFNMSQQEAAGTAQVFAPQIAGSVAGNFAPLPLGIVSFDDDQFASATDIYATYTSFNTTITVNGVDLALDFVATDNWTLGGTLSWVSDDVFPRVTSSNNLPLMLNAPANKLSLSADYRSTDGTWGVNLMNRLTSAYPVNSGVYATGVQFDRPGSTETYTYSGETASCTRDSTTYSCLKSANVLDLGFNWRKPIGGRQVMFSLRVDNVFDEAYRTMPGMPLLGRMFSTRWQYSF
jgi:iron complex outermembrane receptor protein